MAPIDGRLPGRVMTESGLLRELRRRLADAGLTGSFLVRDLHTGAQIGLDPERELPIASLVKIPIVLTVLNRIVDGELDPAAQIEVAPGAMTDIGPAGISRFRHPVRLALDDLLYLSIALSDNTATDALLPFASPASVNDALRSAGITGITVRHGLRELTETVADRLEPDDAHLAQAVAIGARQPGLGRPIPQLDVSRTNVGSARAFTDLLHALWQPTRVAPATARRLRSLMAGNVHQQRLTPDFRSDAAAWSSKTGTLLNLRHEVGVVEHDDGAVLAVAALTESVVPARFQPAAEAVMGAVARALHDHLRANAI
jgi:beta-lactamase class A